LGTVPRFGRTALLRHVDSEEANTIAILELDETMALKLNVELLKFCSVSVVGLECKEILMGPSLFGFIAGS
jgi:hypothetical protein